MLTFSLISTFAYPNWITQSFLASRDFAYLDPGSGSFIIQLVIATVLGSLFIIKGYWKKIVAFFIKNGPVNEKDDVNGSDTQD